MSKGLGVKQRIILEILVCNSPSYLSRNRLVYIIASLLYTKIKSKYNPSSEEIKRKELQLISKEEMKRKERISKDFNRCMKSLIKQDFIKPRINLNSQDFCITKEGVELYEKFQKTEFKKPKGVRNQQGRVIKISHLLWISREFKRNRLNCKKRIKTTEKIRPHTPILDLLEGKIKGPISI